MLPSETNTLVIAGWTVNEVIAQSQFMIAKAINWSVLCLRDAIIHEEAGHFTGLLQTNSFHEFVLERTAFIGTSLAEQADQYSEFPPDLLY